MDDRILDPDGARERLAAWKERIDALAANTQAMSDQLREVRVTASDPGGLVEVTIDSTGSMVDLKLTDRTQRKDPSVVAQTILATLGEAKNRLAERSREIVAGTVGTESPAGRAIVDSVEQHLRGDRPGARGSAQSGEDDDGYDLGSVMRRK